MGGDGMEKRHRIGLAVVLLAVLAAYANSFHNGFHFDDFHTVVDNPAVRSLKNVPRFFTDATTFSVLPANRTYRPFVSTSLAVDYMLGRGYVPVWFHVGTFCAFSARWCGVLFTFYRLVLDTHDGPSSGECSFAIALIAAQRGSGCIRRWPRP